MIWAILTFLLVSLVIWDQLISMVKGITVLRQYPWATKYFHCASTFQFQSCYSFGNFLHGIFARVSQLVSSLLGLSQTPIKASRDCHYTTLGVSAKASRSEIKAAYKKMSLKYHPDKNHGNQEAVLETSRRINEAWEVRGKTRDIFASLMRR